MVYIWLGIIVALIIVELITFKAISIWFAVSAIMSLISQKFVDSYFMQIILFLVVGFLLLTIFRPGLIKLYDKRKGKVKKIK